MSSPIALSSPAHTYTRTARTVVVPEVIATSPSGHQFSRSSPVKQANQSPQTNAKNHADTTPEDGNAVDKTKFHGVGTLSYEDGTVQEGTFVNGRLDAYGTTYFPDGSIFAGMYKNGVPCGQGCFRTPDNEISEGNWSEGRMTGPGLHKTPEVEYRGNFQSGLFHGQGSWKKSSGDSYTGEWFEGTMQGYGVFTFSDGTVQEGVFKDDLLNGRGTSTFPNGSSYVGEFVQGKPHGHGRFTLSNGDYSEGNWIDGKMTGVGTHVTIIGLRYDGDFVDGTKHGHGRLSRPNGSVYEGAWKEGCMTGRGVVTFPDNSVHSGEFKDGVLCGHGSMSYGDGTKLEGFFVDGKIRGFGSLALADGSWMQGVWKHHKLHGEGTFVTASGAVYSGRFRKGLKDGPAVFSPPRCDFVIRGIWSAGSLDGPCEIVYDDGKIVKAEAVNGKLKIGDGVGLAATPSLLKDLVPAAIPQSPASLSRHPASPRLVELLERAAAETESLRRVQKAKRDALLAMERTPEVDKRLDALRLQAASLERVQTDRIAAATAEAGLASSGSGIDSPFSARSSSPTSTASSPSSVSTLDDIENALPPRILVRSIVRIRPPPKKGGSSTGPRSLAIVGKNTIDVRRASGSSKLSARFKADAVFDTKATQLQVFESSGVHMVASAINGLNTTLLAWGGRNTGKSFTMFGTDKKATAANGLESGMVSQFLERLFKDLAVSSDLTPPDSTPEVLISVAALAVRSIVDALPTKDGTRRANEAHATGLAERTITSAKEGIDILSTALSTMSQYTPLPSPTVLVQIHLRATPMSIAPRHTVTSFVDVATPIAAQDKSSASALRTLSSRICNFLTGKRAGTGDSADLRWSSLFKYIFTNCWRLHLVCHLNPAEQAPSEVHATLSCAQSIQRHRVQLAQPGSPEPASPLIPSRSSLPRVSKLLSGRSKAPLSPGKSKDKGSKSGSDKNGSVSGSGRGTKSSTATSSPRTPRPHPRGVEYPTRRARLSSEEDFGSNVAAGLGLGGDSTPPSTPPRGAKSPPKSTAGSKTPRRTAAKLDGLTSTPQCRANIADLQSCRRGNPANIIVTAHAEGGHRRTTGGDNFSVLVAYADQDATVVPSVDNNDGTYTAVFTPVSSGEYTISIMRYGLHVMESPFKITVPRGKDERSSAAVTHVPPAPPPQPRGSPGTASSSKLAAPVTGTAAQTIPVTGSTANTKRSRSPNVVAAPVSNTVQPAAAVKGGGAALGVQPVAGPGGSVRGTTPSPRPAGAGRDPRLSDVSAAESDVSEHVHSTYFISETKDDVQRVYSHSGYNIKREHGRPLPGGLPHPPARITHGAGTMTRSTGPQPVTRLASGTTAPVTTVQPPSTHGRRQHPHTFRATGAATGPSDVRILRR